MTLAHEDVVYKKEVLRVVNGNRYMNSGTSGYIYEQLFDAVEEKYGLDVYPLILDCNVDDMPVDGLGKRTLKPVKCQLKNLKPNLTRKHSA